jgi:hypothetical protein
VDTDRPDPGPRPHDVPDDPSVDEKWAGVASIPARFPSGRDQGSIGHADRGHVQHCAEVQGEPAASRVIPAGGVEDEHVGTSGKRSNGPLEVRTPHQRQETRAVARIRSAPDDRAVHDLASPHDHGARPHVLAADAAFRVSGSGRGEHTADGECLVSRPPRRLRRGELDESDLQPLQIRFVARPPHRDSIICREGRSVVTMARLESYRFGHLVVDGEEQVRDVIVLPSRIVRNWWRRDGHSLVAEDLADVLDELPERLIVGTGHDGRMQPDPSCLEELRRRGVEVEVARTDDAVRRYETLDPAATAAALHLTC